jgi:hypothetical protein
MLPGLSDAVSAGLTTFLHRAEASAMPKKRSEKVRHVSDQPELSIARHGERLFMS